MAPFNSKRMGLPSKKTSSLVDLPQCNDFDDEFFFVRPCHPRYYAILIAMLATKVKYISVTGTPGIGTSIFYLYFVKKWRSENPDKIVVAAAWSKKNKLMKCVRIHTSGTAEQLAAVPVDHVDLYLYNGPPPFKPAGAAKMIAFTSPNFSWFDEIQKNAYHRTVHMPTWSLPELQQANEELEKDVSDETLWDRFQIFGGIARYCLETDEVVVDEARSNINKGLQKITSFDSLRDCFEGNLFGSTSLMHYKLVDPNKLHQAELVPASVQVSMLMKARVQRRLDADRQKLMHWLDGSSKASVFSGWLFEEFVHEQFQDGGVFPCRLLGSQRPTEEGKGMAESEMLILQGTEGNWFYQRFKQQLALEQIFRHVYSIPEAQNLPSIDSFVQVGGVLNLFQITRNANHPVGSEGILSLLKQLKVLDQVRNKQLVVRLVFVVPASMKNTYLQQNILHKEELILNEDEIRSRDCSTISGIATKKRKLLRDRGIENVGSSLTPIPKKCLWQVTPLPIYALRWKMRNASVFLMTLNST